MTYFEFWNWLAMEENRLKLLPLDSIVNELDIKLVQVDSFLSSEVSVNCNPPELIISANGNKKHFESAKSLVAAMPGNISWLVYALKPLRGFAFSLSYYGKDINASHLVFNPLEVSNDSTKLGIRLALPRTAKATVSEARKMACLILQTGVGEELFSNIDYLDTVNGDEESTFDWISVSELAHYIKWHLKRTQTADLKKNASEC